MGVGKTKNTSLAVARAPMFAQSVLVIAAALWGLFGPALSHARFPWIALAVLAVAVLVWFLAGSSRRERVAVAANTEPIAQPPQRLPENRGYFDDLTALPARTWFDHLVESEIARAKRYRHTLSQVLVDIDGFDRINRDHGRANGDYVLVTVADLLRTSVRVSDQIARVAADEFVILVPETDLAGAQFVAEKVRRAVELFPFDNGMEVTVSIGIAAVVDNDTRETFLARATNAVMAAKNRGGNAYVVAKT